MELLMNYAMVLLGLAFFVIYLNKSNKYLDFLTFLYLSLGVTLFIGGFSDKEQGTQLISFLILFMAIHFVINHFVSSPWSKIFPLLSIGGFFFFMGKTIDFQEYPLVFDFKNMLIMPVLAVVFPFIVEWKAKFLSRFFPELELENSIYHVASGILILISLFFGSTFGLVLTGVTLYGTEIYLNRNKEHKNYHSVLIFSIALLSFLAEKSGVEMANILQSSTLFGLLVGTGIGILFSKAFQIAHNRYVAKTVVMLIALAFTCLVIFMELFKEHLGGVPGFAGLIIGFLLVSKARNELLNLSFLAFSFGILIIALPKLQAPNGGSKNSKFDKIGNAGEGEKGPKGKDITTIAGDWKINGKASRIDFELGPKDTRTKGEFKTVEGEIMISEEAENSFIKATVPMTGFSTFNSYRDEGLLGEEYFAAEKFPVLTFKSVKWSDNDGVLPRGRRIHDERHQTKSGTGTAPRGFRERRTGRICAPRREIFARPHENIIWNPIRRSVMLLILPLSSNYANSFIPALAAVCLMVLPFGAKSQGFFENDTVFNKKRGIGVTAMNTAIGAGSIIALQSVWYSDYEKTPLHSFNDSKNWLQMDKAGHVYATYHFNELVAKTYRWSGINRRKSALLGAAYGWGYQFAIEMLDGQSSGWGFSWSDLTANTLGSALYTGQEFAFENKFSS